MNSENPDLIRKKIREYLANNDLEIELEDPNKEFSVIYSTSILAQESDDVSKLTRNYWINQNKTGGQISYPWGPYIYEQQCNLAANLIIFAKYKIKSITNGWELTCQQCGHKQQGPIWRNNPKSCEKCNSIFGVSDKTMTPFTA